MTKSEIYLSALAKAKVAFGAKNDFELANKIGIDNSQISRARKAGKAPVRAIVDAAIDNGNISLDWIFGINAKKISNGGGE